MKLITGFIIACTMLFCIIISVVVCVRVAKTEERLTTETIVGVEHSTKYPILLPKNLNKSSDIPNQQVKVEVLELHNESLLDWDNLFKRCGQPVEGCPELTIDSTKNDSSPNGTEPKKIVSNPQPTLCRCDDKCIKYGDCCATILTRLKKIPKDTYWRCNRLLDSGDSIRMISKCPALYPENQNRRLCENPECPNNGASMWKSICPWLDVPVINNSTGDVYRNIFCSKCHSIDKQYIYTPNHVIYCNNVAEWNKSRWEEFGRTAVYHPRRLKWTDPNESSVECNLNIKELQPNVIGKLVPDVRFCRRDAKEECSLDLSTEENRITFNLCFGYKQLVSAEYGNSSIIYKNPHCAKCDNPNIDIKRTPICQRAPRTELFAEGFHGAFRNIPQADPGPVGINILFHFSVDMDDGYVGVSNKCTENEILDFIRQKCVPLICPKGYTLVNGQCDKSDPQNNDTLVFPRDTVKNASGSDNTSSTEPCFLIILHNGEYKQLVNGSLAVNKSGSSGGILIFQPGEYEKYNESSMSICAENVENGFESSFGPWLSYISNILLGMSVCFLLAHVVLYLILPKMKNLPGNNLFSLTGSLLISQLIFLIFIKAENASVCVMSAITMHYFFLAAFCWMNIMSFDIWRTFSNEFFVRRYSGDSKKTFIKYSMFAWITPLLIVGLAVVTNFYLPESLLSDQDFGLLVKKLRPLYGYNHLCWIGQRLSLFVFFAFPVALIILCNMILFTITASTIFIQNREASRFINGNTVTDSNMIKMNKPERNKNRKIPLHGVNSGSTKQSDKIRFKLYAKLALIMGLTWILGFLSGFTEWEWLWYPFVIFNGLQGTFIFVAFDCKVKIWQMVKEKCGWRKKKSRKGESGEEGTSSAITRQGTTTLSSSLPSTSLKSISKCNSNDNQSQMSNHTLSNVI